MTGTQPDALNLQKARKCNHVQPLLPCQGLSKHFGSALPAVSQGRGQFGEQITTNLPFLAEARRSGFLFLLYTSKGKRWRCSRCWLCLPVSTAGLTAFAWWDFRKQEKQGPSVDVWDPQQDYETTAKTGTFWMWADLIGQCLVKTASQWQGQPPSLPCVCSQRILFPYQTKTVGIDGAIKRRVRALRGWTFLSMARNS